MAQARVSYESAGVDYEQLDAGKRHSLAQALLTSGLAASRGAVAVDASRGEPAFLCWRHDEEQVAFWHPAGKGFADRTPLPAATGSSVSPS